MFNGLIRDFGRVRSLRGERLEIASNLAANINAKIGDSIAINGVCLSVTELLPDGFAVQLSSETAARAAAFKSGARVHLEPAMALGERIDGHLIQGHVDAIAVLKSRSELDCGLDLWLELLPEYAELARFIAPKGSIALAGVSLTVNEVLNSAFRLTLIPITLEKTLLAELKLGEQVNIETDLLARYAERILEHSKKPARINYAAIY